MPYREGEYSDLMAALGIVGSDVKDFECPRCGSHDRERHLFLYLKASGILDSLGGLRILHFAPEKRLSKIIAMQSPRDYVRGDLYPSSADIKRIDMESIGYPTASFDLVIANHVLEHVTRDHQALSEIHRVLAPNGLAILQTPYSSVLHHTWADSGIDSRSARLHAYGQEDHVRLYAQDIFSMIERSGFIARIGQHDQLLADKDHSVHGVNPHEPFFLFQRI